MSDNIPLEKQQACGGDISEKADEFLVDIFSGARGHDGSYKQLYFYIRKACGDLGGRSKSLKEEQSRLGLCRVLACSKFFWKEGRKKLTVKIDMGDLSASKEVKRRKILEMTFPEKIVFTLPTCNATRMEVIASLMNENQELLLTTGPQVIELSKLKLPVEETRPAVEHTSIQEQHQPTCNTAMLCEATCH